MNGSCEFVSTSILEEHFSLNFAGSFLTCRQTVRSSWKLGVRMPNFYLSERLPNQVVPILGSRSEKTWSTS